MIKFENVVFGYGEEKNALNYVSFHISEGEQVGLIGANGAGKSTLMKAMLGLIPAKGKITVDEIEVNQENSSRIWQCLRYVFQDSDNQMFMPTVYEDMIFGPLNYGKSRKEADQLAREALEELDLIHLKDRQNYKMSGGEKRMAAIATILAMNPKVMLMDEPSTALDPKNRRRLIRILQKLPTTKIIATHDLESKMTAADADIYICFVRIVNCNRKAENNCNFTYCTKMRLVYWLICSMCGGGSFQWGHDLIIGEAHLLNHAPKGRNRLFLGMLNRNTCVSIPNLLLLCLVIGLVTVHTCELIKVSLSRPTA